MSARTGKAAAKAEAKKGKKNAKGGPEAGSPSGVSLSIAAHPQAANSVRQIKGAVSLAAFTIALALSLQAAVPLATATERALVAGVAGWLVAWACAVAVWRALLLAELRARVEDLHRQHEQAAGGAATR
ncbi:MAG TPA: hypothetical protein VFN48_01355 [Solirubrobacteraceae bacterium]|nr:hypothetical protein [Solirubrobacteraceae bacterium]